MVELMIANLFSKTTLQIANSCSQSQKKATLLTQEGALQRLHVVVQFEILNRNLKINPVDRENKLCID